MFFTRVAAQGPEEPRKPDIMDQIRQAAGRVDEYCAINQAQVKRSFSSSLLTLIVGSITLIAGIWLCYLRPDSTQVSVATLAAVGGLMTDFVGAGYFCIYRMSLQQQHVFVEKAQRSQDTLLLIRLLDEWTSVDSQSSLRHELIRSIMLRANVDRRLNEDDQRHV